MSVNDRQRLILADRLIAFFNGTLQNRTIAIWGLAFKPNTDDIREAPALYIIDKLLEAGARIKAFDPEAMPNVRRLYAEKIELCPDPYEALIDADALAIVTEWSVFRAPNYPVMKKLLKQPVLFDGRNLYDLDLMAEQGFYYESIGRAVVGAAK